jgi:hypothetical protein
VKFVALWTVPITPLAFVTVSGPVVALAGTVALICVAETNATVEAFTPLNFTFEPLLNPTP